MCIHVCVCKYVSAHMQYSYAIAAIYWQKRLHTFIDYFPFCWIFGLRQPDGAGVAWKIRFVFVGFVLFVCAFSWQQQKRKIFSIKYNRFKQQPIASTEKKACEHASAHQCCVYAMHGSTVVVKRCVLIVCFKLGVHNSMFVYLCLRMCLYVCKCIAACDTLKQLFNNFILNFLNFALWFFSSSSVDFNWIILK